jgi:hypothetical protein
MSNVKINDLTLASTIDSTMQLETDIGGTTANKINITQLTAYIQEQIPHVSFANTVYVATNGNDTTGDGTYHNPYASIQAALTSIGSAADSTEFADPTKRYYKVHIAPGIYTGNLSVPSRPLILLDLRAAVIVGNVTQDINRNLLAGSVNTSKLIISSDDLLGEHTNLTEPRNGIQGNVLMTSSVGANNFSSLMLLDTGVSGNVTFDCTNVAGYTGFLFTNNCNIGGTVQTAGASTVNINMYCENADTPGSTGIGGIAGRVNFRLLKNVNFSGVVQVNSSTGGRLINVTFASVANNFTGTTAAYQADANSYASYFTNVPTKGSETFTLIDKARGVDAQYTPTNYSVSGLDVRAHLAGIDTKFASVGSTWNVVTSSTAIVVDNNYAVNSASLVTLTLPTTIAAGKVIRIANYNTGGFRIAQNAGQTIRYGSSLTTAGTGGRLDSSMSGDVVELLCVVANSGFLVLSSIGNLDVI